MRVTGEADFISAKSGVSKKTGKDYFTAKFLDAEAEEFAQFFIEESLFHELETLPKHTSVILTLDVALQSRYFSLISIEVVQ